MLIYTSLLTPEKRDGLLQKHRIVFKLSIFRYYPRLRDDDRLLPSCYARHTFAWCSCRLRDVYLRAKFWPKKKTYENNSVTSLRMGLKASQKHITWSWYGWPMEMTLVYMFENSCYKSWNNGIMHRYESTRHVVLQWMQGYRMGGRGNVSCQYVDMGCGGGSKVYES